jgi:hypothetical protein
MAAYQPRRLRRSRCRAGERQPCRSHYRNGLGWPTRKGPRPASIGALRIVCRFFPISFVVEESGSLAPLAGALSGFDPERVRSSLRLREQNGRLRCSKIPSA